MLLNSDARRSPLADGVDLSFPYLRDQARTRLGLDKLDAWRNGRHKVETKLEGLPMFEVIDE